MHSTIFNTVNIWDHCSKNVFMMLQFVRYSRSLKFPLHSNSENLTICHRVTHEC